jgi:hypothetical protein
MFLAEERYEEYLPRHSPLFRPSRSSWRKFNFVMCIYYHLPTALG